MTIEAFHRLMLAALIGLITIPLAAQQGGATPNGDSATTKEPEDDGPWRLQQVIDDLGGPSWLRISGSMRCRVEGISGQFRAAGALDDSDIFLVMRTTLRADLDFDPVRFVLEGIDSRHLGANDGSFLDTTVVNAVELLQATVGFDLGELGSGRHELRAGRMTIDVGSRRLVARNRFRNTINSFTGAEWRWTSDETSIQAFWTMPVNRLPSDFPSLEDNDLEFDDEDDDRQFFGAWASFDVYEKHSLEVYGFGLLEDASNSRHRNLGTLGLRFLRPEAVGEFDYELEGAYQFGESRTSAAGADLDHSAFFVHFWLGYTFDCDWKPRIQIAFDYASGDDDPTDGNNERFDTLFGARRWEYGPTGIFGAVARSNLLSPELRLVVSPAKDMRAFVAVRGIFLASDTDAWTPAGVRDVTGSSGTHVGTQFEANWRWDIIPKGLRLEAGLAFILHGEFQDDATGGQGEDTLYGYVQMAWTF